MRYEECEDVNHHAVQSYLVVLTTGLLGQHLLHALNITEKLLVRDRKFESGMYRCLVIIIIIS